MAKWETEHALMQAEVDLINLNNRDRDLIFSIERRIKQRSRLIKLLRRRFRKQGLVNVSTDSANPYYLHRNQLSK